MSKEKDLESFREEWQKELHVKTLQPLQDIQPSTSVELQGNGQVVQSVENNDNVSSIHFDSGNNSIKKDSIFEDDQQDDNSLEGFISNSSSEQQAKVHPLYNYNESTDSCEYYPFRILTQFLNEAPKKAKISPSQREKLARNSQGETYSKRKYFQSTSLQQQRLKFPKQQSTTKDVSEKGTQDRKGDSKRMLDIFLADLDEINEIPFFDSTLPREVAVNIFQNLDMRSLCKCAQVSRSWRSLADDDHLWCTIFNQLGYVEKTKVGDFNDWKSKVQQFVEDKRLLESNWKARIGKPYNLSNAKGGVLCAVHSHESTIVAGYTDCSVKSWNTLSGDSCTFNASNTSMVIDETAEDFGRIHNEMRHLKTTAQITAASFRHGFVDVWWNDFSTDPVHTIIFNGPDVSSLCVQDIDIRQSAVAASQSTRLHVALIDKDGGKMLADFNMKNAISDMLWLQEHHFAPPRLVIATTNSVWLKEFDPYSEVSPLTNLSQDEMDLKEIHSIIMAPVTCIATRPRSSEVGVGFNVITGPSVQIKVNVYAADVGKLKTSLRGHTWLISCMHMPQALANRLVTGSADRKVRLFDAQAQKTPVLTLAGHSAKVTNVQMDEIKVVSSDEAGFVRVWDQRMGRKLWDLHNRHPVRLCHFDGRLLIIGNIPYQKFPEQDEFESVSSLRYRGTVQFYDFLANQQRAGVPEICLSSYNEPEASISNIGLAVPYDNF